jgi:hypothetical protein
MPAPPSRRRDVEVKRPSNSRLSVSQILVDSEFPSVVPFRGTRAGVAKLLARESDTDQGFVFATPTREPLQDTVVYK